MQSNPKPRTAQRSAKSNLPKKRHGERGPDRKPRKIRSDAKTCISSISHLIYDPAVNNRWLAAMRERLPYIRKCEHVMRNGDVCQCPAVKSYHLCINHADRRELNRLDDVRYQQAEETIERTASKSIAVRARKVQLAIERRRLLFLWSPRGANQPETVGLTLRLNPGDSTAVANRLKQAGVDIFADKLTYRCIDRLRWLGYFVLVGRIDDALFGKRVKRVLRQDAKYWSSKTQSD